MLKLTFLLLYINLIVKPSLPLNYSESTCQKLQEAIVAIQMSTPIIYSLEELYQAVENMCSHKMDSKLYLKLKDLAESHVKCNVDMFVGGSMDKLVSSFKSMWFYLIVYSFYLFFISFICKLLISLI